jgi:hypothetical protein
MQTVRLSLIVIGVQIAMIICVIRIGNWQSVMQSVPRLMLNKNDLRCVLIIITMMRRRTSIVPRRCISCLNQSRLRTTLGNIFLESRSDYHIAMRHNIRTRILADARELKTHIAETEGMIVPFISSSDKDTPLAIRELLADNYRILLNLRTELNKEHTFSRQIVTQTDFDILDSTTVALSRLFCKL